MKLSDFGKGIPRGRSKSALTVVLKLLDQHGKVLLAKRKGIYSVFGSLLLNNKLYFAPFKLSKPRFGSSKIIHNGRLRFTFQVKNIAMIRRIVRASVHLKGKPGNTIGKKFHFVVPKKPTGPPPAASVKFRFGPSKSLPPKAWNFRRKRRTIVVPQKQLPSPPGTSAHYRRESTRTPSRWEVRRRYPGRRSIRKAPFVNPHRNFVNPHRNRLARRRLAAGRQRAMSVPPRVYRSFLALLKRMRFDSRRLSQLRSWFHGKNQRTLSIYQVYRILRTFRVGRARLIAVKVLYPVLLKPISVSKIIRLVKLFKKYKRRLIAAVLLCRAGIIDPYKVHQLTRFFRYRSHKKKIHRYCR